MSIFGISILDFYGISFIASFYAEITSILGNITGYLTNTHFYSILSGLFTQKVEVVETNNALRTNNKSSTGSENGSKINQ
jgi:hypothetical protein